MATAKSAPAKTTKKAATPAAADDDLLAPKVGKAKAAGKGKTAAPADDDLLAPKGGKSKPAAKSAKAAAAPAKKAAKPRAAKDTVGTTEDVRAVLLKTRKLTSYADIASANNFDIRMVRRTARAARDAGEIELQKEGTIQYVKVAKKA